MYTLNKNGKKVQVNRKTNLQQIVEDDLLDKVYKSRRDKKYDNDDSNGEDDDIDSDGGNKSGAIKYIDTKGNMTSIMPN